MQKKNSRRERENHSRTAESAVSTTVVYDPIVVRVFRLGGDSETRTYVLRGGTFQRDDRGPVVHELGDGIGEIYRIVYFSYGLTAASNTPLLVVDVNPATLLQINPNRRELTIDGVLLCALNSRPYITLASKITANATKFRHDKLDLSNGIPPPAALLMNVPTNAEDRLKVLVEGRVVGTPPRPLVVPPLIHANGLASTLLNRHTGLNLPEFAPPACRDNRYPLKTMITFVKKSYLRSASTGAQTPTAVDPDFYALVFRLTTSDTTKCDSAPDDARGRIKTFGEDFSYQFQRREAPDQWKLVQRPANSISPNPITGGPATPAWLLLVYGVPTRIAQLSSDKLSNEYFLALNRVQGGRPVSFFPHFGVAEEVPVDTAETSGWWVMTHRMVDTISGEDRRHVLERERVRDTEVVVSPLSLHFWKALLPGQLTAKVTVTLPQIKTLDGNSLGARVMDLVKSFEPDDGDALERLQGVVLQATRAIYTENAMTPQIVRMGALDLEFGTNTADGGAQHQFLVRREGNLVGAHIDAHFRVSGIFPGGQDDPAGEEFVPDRSTNFGATDSGVETARVPLSDEERNEECVEAAFRRKRPIVIYERSAGSANELFLLRVREDVRPRESQAIRLEILSQKPETPGETVASRSVIILDRNPFLVAQVRYKPFDKPPRFAGNTIAIWDNTSGDGAAWRLQVDEKPFELVLPPQAVGEEMVKDDKIDDHTAFNFNLSPPAVLRLDPRAARTRFSEAPWNLRRILGAPGEAMAGPAVEKIIQYELLYGLSCEADKPAVRLAEIFSRVGRIPARQEREMLWSATSVQQEDYHKRRLEWSKLYRRYLSRVAVLEPWNSILPGVQQSVVLSEGLSCVIRLPPKSNLKAPFDPPSGLNGSLRGGATWGFESKNVYNAIIDPANKYSTSAELSDFYLSSFGGWGHQKAAFQNDLTKIYADVEMGRTYRYKLERIGRIAVFWNLAKHVIVYERTVVPSRQFMLQQQPMKGWPVIRKVREYVEILEDTRGYPDYIDPAARPELALRARGFVASCSFRKGAQYNVLSSWGTDVGDIGWKVPLWNPGAEPSDVYPKPKVSLGVISNLSEVSTVVPATIAEPQNIYFFTQTKVKRNGKDENPDRDPHKWDPVPDVDFVNAPTPEAARDFEGGDPRQYSPEEDAVPPAYGACTFTLDPSTVPINLMAERAPKALAAILETVTMARSRAGGKPWPSSVQKVQDVGNRVTDLYKTFLQRIPLDADPTREILDQLRSIASSNSTFTRLESAIGSAKTEVDRFRSTLKSEIRSLEQNLVTGLVRKATAAIEKPLEDFVEQVRLLVDEADFRIDRARALIGEHRRRIEEVLLLLDSLPGVIPELLARYVDLVAGAAKGLDSGLLEIQGALGTAGADVREARARAGELLQKGRELIRSLETVGKKLPRAWIPDPTSFVRARLSSYFDQFETAATALTNGLERAANTTEALEAIRVFRASAFYTTLQNPQRLRDFVSEVFGVAAAGLEYDAIREAVHKTDKWQRELLDKWRIEVQTRLDLFNARPDKARLIEVRDLLARWLTNAAGGLQTEINRLGADLETQIDKVADVIVAAIGSTEAVLNGIKQELRNMLGTWGSRPLGELQAELEKQRDRFARGANAYLDQTARRIMNGSEPLMREADRTLRLIRAMGNPPRVPKLDFERSKIGYYFKEVAPDIDLTPVISVVNQGAEVLERLKPLGVKLPTRAALEQLIPAELKNFDLSQIFPNFAGLDLRNLFAGLKIPSDVGNDNVKVTHGLDGQTRRAFVRADVDFPITELTTLFTIGPLSLQLPRAHFEATSKIEAGLNGEVRRKVQGKITGDWQIVMSGAVLVKFRNTELFFDDSGGIRFSINPRNIELSGVLTFISDAMKSFQGDDNGLSIGLLPDGFQSVLSLALPDVQAGAFGISNLRLCAIFALSFGDEFAISIGFGIARKDAPFALTIFILGGGGFFEIRSTYVPARRRLTCSIEVGITASASLAIALGPIKGGVYAYFGITAKFDSGGPGMTIGVMFLLRGEVSVLGIISACITLLLEATYNPATKTLVGRGRVSIKIKICWCFTLEVSAEVTLTLGNPPRSRAAMGGLHSDTLVASLNPPPPGIGPVGMADDCSGFEDCFAKYADDYINLFAITA